MLKQDSLKIDEATYKVTQLPFGIGRKVLLRLVKTLAPSIESIAGSEGASLEDISLSNLASGLSAFLDNATEEDIDFVSSELMKSTEVSLGGEYVSLTDMAEVHFAGDYISWGKWLLFAIKVNFLDFLSEKDGLSDADLLLKKAQSLSQKG